MERETVTTSVNQTSVSVAGGECRSLRMIESKETAVRVFQDGKIGISAMIGDGDETALVRQAEEKLASGIAYPCTMPKERVRTVDCRTPLFPVSETANTAKKLLSRLQKCFPDFLFSDKLLSLTEREISYSNSRGTFFLSRDNFVSVGCDIKEKTSLNIVDTGYYARRSFYDEDAIVRDIGEILRAYKRQADLPQEEVPVLIGEDVFGHLATHLVAEMYASGGSLLSGKMGQRIFHENVDLYADYAPRNASFAPFFDTEGTTAEGDRFYYVKEGVLTGLASTRRSAENFGLPLSGGAWAKFDGVPSPAFLGLVSGKTKDMPFPEGRAIYVSMTSGGDMTSDGVLGLPVQLAYLCEDGKLVGRLPEFSMRASIFDVLGKNFMGVFDSPFCPYSGDQLVATKFSIH